MASTQHAGYSVYVTGVVLKTNKQRALQLLPQGVQLNDLGRILWDTA